MSKQGLSQEQINRKEERIRSWKLEKAVQEEKFLSLQDTRKELKHDNLVGIVDEKIKLAMNSMDICTYQINILESQLMVDKLRKDNYKIKTKM